MRKLKTFLVVAIVSLGVAGCAVSQEDKTLIDTSASVGQGNLREWAKLTDAQRLEAQTNLTAAMCVLNKNLNKKELPAWVASLTGAK
jgi:hypothetical protein